jgi:hypothetical protein
LPFCELFFLKLESLIIFLPYASLYFSPGSGLLLVGEKSEAAHIESV